MIYDPPKPLLPAKTDLLFEPAGKQDPMRLECFPFWVARAAAKMAISIYGSRPRSGDTCNSLPISFRLRL